MPRRVGDSGFSAKAVYQKMQKLDMPKALIGGLALAVIAGVGGLLALHGAGGLHQQAVQMHLGGHVVKPGHMLSQGGMAAKKASDTMQHVEGYLIGGALAGVVLGITYLKAKREIAEGGG